MIDIKHGKLITTESHYDGKVASTKQECEISMFSSKEMILKDMIEALDVITRGKTKKLTIEVYIDAKYQYRLKKRWVI